MKTKILIVSSVEIQWQRFPKTECVIELAVEEKSIKWFMILNLKPWIHIVILNISVNCLLLLNIFSILHIEAYRDAL